MASDKAKVIVYKCPYCGNTVGERTWKSLVVKEVFCTLCKTRSYKDFVKGEI